MAANWEDAGPVERHDGFTVQRKRNLGDVANPDYRYWYSIRFDGGSTDVARGPRAYSEALEIGEARVAAMRARAAAASASPQPDVDVVPEVAVGDQEASPAQVKADTWRQRSRGDLPPTQSRPGFGL